MIRFGVFELDPRAGELRKSGIRLKVAEQPVRILLCLLERPGEIVTREELRDLLWGQDTFVDFEHGLNAAINKLREALGDTAANPRFVETVPRRGYRFIAQVSRPILKSGASMVEIPLESAAEEGSPQATGRENASRRLHWVVAVLFVATGIAAGWWWRSVPVTREFSARPLTRDSGLTTSPAISPDGKLVAYASDRATQKNLDIWVQPLAQGAQPIRLTKDEADELDPWFSPDSGLIAFRSTREGGGIYVMPALGGDERLLAPRGMGPRFSPDGKWVAYAVGSGGWFSDSKIFLAPVGGGSPRQLANDVAWASYPVFSPDGRHVLLLGSSTVPTYPPAMDWWVTPVEGGPSVESGILAALRKQGIVAHLNRSPDWLQDRLLFESVTQLPQTQRGHLWEARLSDGQWKLAGRPRQLTTGAGGEHSPRAVRTGDKIRVVFAAGSISTHLWRLHVDPNKGKALGEMKPLSHSGGAQVMPAASLDGRKLIYTQDAPDSVSLRLRDLASGAETTVISLSSALVRGKLSPNGSQIAYCKFAASQLLLQAPQVAPAGPEKAALYLIPAKGGEATKLLDLEGPSSIFGWTPDGRKVVYWDGKPIRFSLVDVETGQRTELISHPKYNMNGAELSPDQRWVAFSTPAARSSPLYVAPVKEGRAPGEEEWIKVADGGVHQERPWWSPDGNLLYFLTTMDGFRCVFAQRLHPIAKRPEGEPFEVYHFHGTRLRSPGAAMNFGPAILPNGIIFGLTEETGNLWLGEIER
ncbi:MAG: winged helix-turn-helix domain-containing protein [Bryobacteraceae bacterium]